MSDLLLTATSGGLFSFDEFRGRCAIGKGGVISAEQKREGDGASPIGTWPLVRVYYRPDRLSRPKTGLPCVPLKPGDGWCDAPDHPLYNRPVRRPFEASHEALWRDDHVYDVIIELAHNSDPVVPGLGSAVFMHIAKPDYTPTEGCVALATDDLLHVLSLSGPGAALQITV